MEQMIKCKMTKQEFVREMKARKWLEQHERSRIFREYTKKKRKYQMSGLN